MSKSTPARSTSPSAEDEELRSPYVSDGNLDVGRWANDALVLAFPSQPICRDDCAGLCSVCGEPLNDADPEAHKHHTGGDRGWRGCAI